ncbi:MAG: hypothetical protein ABS904_00445 [Solibacillus isronensis]
MAYNLVDVSNLLYIGHTGSYRNFSVQTVNGEDIPTGGIYSLLNQFRLRKYNFLNDFWIFCFDRKSFRAELSSMTGVGYRGQRLGMPQELRVQSQEAEKWLRDAGFNVFAYDGFEADDIIATVALALKGTGTQVNIISSDRDFAYLVDENIKVESPNPRVPSVTRQNYNDVAGKRGHRVFYNTSLLYKVICGDQSDNIPPIAKNSYAYYNNLCYSLDSHGIQYQDLADFEMIEAIVDSLPESVRERAKDNWQFIKPRTLDPEMIDFVPQEVNYEVMQNFLELYGMNSILKRFGLAQSAQYPEFIMKYRLDLYNAMFGGNNTEADDEEPIKDAEEVTLTAIEEIELINEQKAEIDVTMNKLFDPKAGEEQTVATETGRNETGITTDFTKKD